MFCKLLARDSQYPPPFSTSGKYSKAFTTMKRHKRSNELSLIGFKLDLLRQKKRNLYWSLILPEFLNWHTQLQYYLPLLFLTPGPLQLQRHLLPLKFFAFHPWPKTRFIIHMKPSTHPLWAVNFLKPWLVDIPDYLTSHFFTSFLWEFGSCTSIALVCSDLDGRARAGGICKIFFLIFLFLIAKTICM